VRRKDGLPCSIGEVNTPETGLETENSRGNRQNYKGVEEEKKIREKK